MIKFSTATIVNFTGNVYGSVCSLETRSKPSRFPDPCTQIRSVSLADCPELNGNTIRHILLSLTRRPCKRTCPSGQVDRRLLQPRTRNTATLSRRRHQEDTRNTKDRTKDLVSRFRGVGYQKRGLPYKKVKASAIKVAVIMSHRPSHFTGDLFRLWRFYAAAIKWPLRKNGSPTRWLPALKTSTLTSFKSLLFFISHLPAWELHKSFIS
jgi:hypothetical protein